MAYQDDDRPRRHSGDRNADSTRGASGSRSGSPRDNRGRDEGPRERRWGASGSSERSAAGRAGRPSGREGRPVRRDDRAGRVDSSGRGDSRELRQVPEWANSRREPLENRRLSPLIPDEITDKDLEIGVRAQLKTLTPENAEKVARHLAMVGLLIDQDPELAHEHALAAADRAGRIAVVRETVGCTAYAVGDYTMALRELLTHRRISGSNEQIALIVDSERGLGRPERGLEIGRSVDRNSLPAQSRVNLAIAMSGARLDQGEPALALAELEIPELNPASVFEYSAPLFFAYADVLEDLGRADESQRWAQLGNRAVAAFAGDDDENIVVLEEYEIPVRRERTEWTERPPRDSERRGFGGRGSRDSAPGADARGERRNFGDRDGRPQRREGDQNGRSGGRSVGGRSESTGRSSGFGRGAGRPGGEGRPSRDGRNGRDDYRPKRDR